MEIIENVSKLVKPSTTTPSTLRNYSLSFFDEKQPNMNVPLILYYSTSHKEQSDIQSNIFDHLEISLAKALTHFYPLAGRYTRHASYIECRDQGAIYIQAKANFQLSDFLSLKWESKLNMLQDFLPCEVSKAGEINDPLLSIKVTTFKCGGVAIGICISHKFADMATFCMFVDNWATKSREIGNEFELKVEKYFPVSNLAHLYPKTGILNGQIFPSSNAVTNYVLRVFSFKGSTIEKLREKIMNDQDNIIRHRPSKVQVTVSLLWKALVDMDKKDGQSKVSFFSQAVNLRNKVLPKEPGNFCGNFFTLANAHIELSERDNVDLHVLLKLLHDSTNKIRSDNSKNYNDYEVLNKPFLEIFENKTHNDVNVYMCSSWSKFSFYTADFGWGKPVWRSITNMKTPNVVIMMDDEDGDGVEAWVHLEKRQMCMLEQDPNIQAYIDI